MVTIFLLTASNMGGDIRQSEQWAEFMRNIGWQVLELETKSSKIKIFIKKIPLIGSVIKIHRPNLPIPLAEIDEIARKNRALFVKIQPNVEKQEGSALINELEEHSYVKDTWPLLPTKTIQIDLTKDEKILLAEMSKDARYSIRRAQKNGVKVEISKRYDEFYRLLKKRGKSRGFHVQRKKEFDARIKAFGERAFLMAAYKPPNEQLLAGALILLHDGNTYYLQAASNDLGRRLYAPYLIMRESLKLAQQKKCETLDLEGVYDPRYAPFKNWKDFTIFKKKFGGKEITYIGAFLKYYNPIFKSLSQYAP